MSLKTRLSERIAELQKRVPLDVDDFNKAEVFWNGMYQVYRDRFKNFGEPEKNNLLFTEFAFVLRQWSIEEIQQIPALLVATNPWPPSLSEFIKMLAASDSNESEIEDLFKHAIQCASSAKYGESYRWKSVAQRYALNKTTFQLCIENELAAFKKFKFFYAQGIDEYKSGNLKHLEDGLEFMADESPKDWTMNQESNRNFINNLKKLSSADYSGMGKDFENMVRRSTQTIYRDLNIESKLPLKWR